MNLYKHFVSLLLGVEKYKNAQGKLLKSLIVEDVLKLDSDLISSLYKDLVIREKFFKKIKGGGICI